MYKLGNCGYRGYIILLKLYLEQMDKPGFGPKHFYFRNPTPNHNLKTTILVIANRNTKF